MSAFSITKAFSAVVLVSAVLTAGCASAPPRNDEAFQRIPRGATMDEVKRAFGPPDETMKFDRTQTESWDYRYRDTWGYEAYYSFTFGTDGRVQSTISRRINAGGDRGK